MAEASYTVSDETRRLIDSAMVAGAVVGGEMARFIYRCALARDAFDREVNPLGLDDDAYERVGRESGLHALLQQATDLEAHLVTLFEDRR